MTEPLTVVAAHGPRAASVRVRAYEWVRRTEMHATFHTWVGSGVNALGATVRHPVRLARASVDLSRLARTAHARLLLHREASPLPFAGIEAAIVQRSAFSVYDFDDGLQWEPSSFTTWMTKRLERTAQAIHQVDRVIAGNTQLAEYAANLAREVVVIPSCVDPAEYELKTNYELGDPPRIGWIGSASGEPYLAEIAPAIIEANRRTGARVTLIGSSHQTLGPLERLIDRVPWIVDLSARHLSRCDVGIMPLPDSLYARGKCAYKLLQYGACGLPSITSPVGMNRSVGTEFGISMPESPAEWTDALIAALEAPASKRQRLGRQSLTAVEDGYTYDVWRSHWLAAVESDDQPAEARDR